MIFKLFFDIISSRDNTLSRADALETRKTLLTASMRLLANSKYKAMVEPNIFSSVVMCALDDNAEMRKHTLNLLVSGLFGMKKAQGQPLILNPLWTVVLVFLAEDPQKEDIGNMARNALTR